MVPNGCAEGLREFLPLECDLFRLEMRAFSATATIGSSAIARFMIGMSIRTGNGLKILPMTHNGSSRCDLALAGLDAGAIEQCSHVVPLSGYNHNLLTI